MNRSRTAITFAALGLVIAACGTDPKVSSAAHGGSGDHGSEADSPVIDGAPEVDITAGAMAFDPAVTEVTVGEPINLALTSEDVLHDLTVDEVGFHVVADAGERAVAGILFDEPGTYTAYCSVPGHREAGMELELTVDS